MSGVVPREPVAAPTDADVTRRAAEESEERIIESKAVHILYVSAGMIGVCLTVIGVVNLLIHSAGVDLVMDEVLAVDSLVFLAACVCAYGAMGAKTLRAAQRRERYADIFMMVGLTVMVLVAVVVAFELAR